MVTLRDTEKLKNKLIPAATKAIASVVQNTHIPSIRLEKQVKMLPLKQFCELKSVLKL